MNFWYVTGPYLDLSDPAMHGVAQLVYESTPEALCRNPTTPPDLLEALVAGRQGVDARAALVTMPGLDEGLRARAMHRERRQVIWGHYLGLGGRSKEEVATALQRGVHDSFFNELFLKSDVLGTYGDSLTRELLDRATPALRAWTLLRYPDAFDDVEGVWFAEHARDAGYSWLAWRSFGRLSMVRDGFAARRAREGAPWLVNLIAHSTRIHDSTDQIRGLRIGQEIREEFVSTSYVAALRAAVANPFTRLATIEHLAAWLGPTSDPLGGRRGSKILVTDARRRLADGFEVADDADQITEANAVARVGQWLSEIDPYVACDGAGALANPVLADQLFGDPTSSRRSTFNSLANWRGGHGLGRSHSPWHWDAGTNPEETPAPVYCDLKVTGFASSLRRTRGSGSLLTPDPAASWLSESLGTDPAVWRVAANLFSDWEGTMGDLVDTACVLVDVK